MASGRAFRSRFSSTRSLTISLFGAMSIATGAACGGDADFTNETEDPTTTTATTGGGGGSLPNLTGVGGQDRKVVTLAFEPAHHKVILDGEKAQTVDYKLIATFEDETKESVAAEALQFDRPDLADLVLGPPIQLIADGQYAGTGNLYAVFRGVEATATLDIEVRIRDLASGVSDADAAKLDQPNLPQDGALKSLLYPYDKTVFPQGLTSPLLMWNGPNAGDIYRVHYEQPNYSYDGYVKPDQEASARMPQKYWDKMVASNPGGPMNLEVSRLDASSNTAFSSAKQQWTIAAASLRGAIYYWTTSGTGGLSRINPGGAEESLLKDKCVGCHAVSSDGSTLVATREEYDANGKIMRPWSAYDLPDMKERSRSADTTFGGNLAVNNDGKYLVYGNRDLRLGDTATGKEIPNSGVELAALTSVLSPGANGLMTPVFSPDGKKFAAVDGKGPSYFNLYNGKLLVLDFNPATMKFTNPKPLAGTGLFPSGQRAINYPSFTPDSSWLAFQVGDVATGCEFGSACDDTVKTKARLFLQSTAGGDVIDLATLNDGSPNPADHNLSYEPTFNPIERGGYFWVVFTSSRDWGHKVVGPAQNGKKRLWVGAIRKDPGSAKDPSFPPFYLEGQNDKTTNMRGFWALSQCIPTGGGGTCEAGFECCDGFCDKGKCVSPQEFSCVGIGGECTTGADCCNDKVVNCIDGTCQVGGPK